MIIIIIWIVIRIIDLVFSKQTMTHLPLLAGGFGICIVRYYTSSSGLANDPVNGLVTETAHEGRSEGRNEGRREALTKL